MQSLRGLRQNVPVSVSSFVNQKCFDPGSCFGVADQAGGKNPRVIQDDQISGPNKRGQLSKRMISAFARGSINDHHTRCISMFRCRLRDEAWRQLVIKIGDSHRSVSAGLSQNRLRHTSDSHILVSKPVCRAKIKIGIFLFDNCINIFRTQTNIGMRAFGKGKCRTTMRTE